MIPMTFRPIERWPGNRTSGCRRSPFRAGYSDTLSLLDDELRAIGARSVVLQLALSESEILQDGSRPYANARPQHPGVIVAFTAPKTGPMQFPCDTFSEWQDNLRAIAMAMKALRAVDRYGVTKRGEQYTGWKQLPPGAVLVTPPAMTVEEAAGYLAEQAGLPRNHGEQVRTNADFFRTCYREAARRCHPDAAPGKEAEWHRLQAAVAVLEKHLHL